MTVKVKFYQSSILMDTAEVDISEIDIHVEDWLSVTTLGDREVEIKKVEE